MKLSKAEQYEIVAIESKKLLGEDMAISYHRYL